jgi:hypothetical protein
MTRTRQPARAQVMPMSCSSPCSFGVWWEWQRRMPGMDVPGFSGRYRLAVTHRPLRLSKTRFSTRWPSPSSRPVTRTSVLRRLRELRATAAGVVRSSRSAPVGLRLDLPPELQIAAVGGVAASGRRGQCHDQVGLAIGHPCVGDCAVGEGSATARGVRQTRARSVGKSTRQGRHDDPGRNRAESVTGGPLRTLYPVAPGLHGSAGVGSGRRFAVGWN